MDLDDAADALESADADRVNDTIDRLSSADPVERFERFDELHDACRTAYAHEDGYVRQSAVRLLRETYPTLEFRFMGPENEAVEGITLADTVEHRDRYVEFLLEALEDDDGRVRKASAQGFRLLGTAWEAAELEGEREALKAVLEDLAAEQPPEKRKHTEQGLNHVRTFGERGFFDHFTFETDSW